MIRDVRWIVLALSIVVMVLAFMFRYEPLPLQNNPMEITVVWDRLLHRVCMIGHNTGQQMVCTLDEIDQFGRQKR